MNQRLRYALNFIKYWLFAKHRKGHGIHSPFLFQLITKVLNNKNINSDLKKVFTIYDKYKKSSKVIDFNEIGAKSNVLKRVRNQISPSGVLNPQRASIGRIIKTSSVNKKFGCFLYNLVNHFKPGNILELGSSVGISTSFIALANPKSHFISIEGIEEKIKVAKNVACELHHNTKFVTSNLDDSLENIIKEFDKLDFVYFDANHTKESTLKYFNLCINKSHNDSVFVFDDIHWSKGMEEAWAEIKNNKNVRLSVDLYRMGLIFFRKELSKEHYVIKF